MKMKILIATIAFSSVLCAQEPEVITTDEISQVMMEKLPENERFNYIMKLPKGTELPMSVTIHGDFFSASSEGEEAFTVEVKQDLFIKFKDDSFLASLDGENWKTMEEFFTGSFGWSVCDDAAAKFGLYLEANLRK